MAPRPRRAAAQKANTAITDMVDSDNNSSSRPARAMSSSSRNSSRRPEVKLPASKLRQTTTSRPGSSKDKDSVIVREGFVGGEIIEGKRNRGQHRNYALDTSDEEDEDTADVDAEGDDDDMAEGDDDAEGEIIVDDTMDLDAEGEDDDALGDDDAEGEDDMDVDVPRAAAPTIKVSKPTRGAAAAKNKTPTKSTSKPLVQAKDSDDDELSELDSDEDDIQDTVKVGGADPDEDAEGDEDDEIEAAGVGAGDDDELDSDDSQAETPDMSKMTRRQRARFEDSEGSLLKLSDEVQAKKVFTAEELSMRRAEMARRRRNLSEKRNEEVKMETINKLLKKQAPKTKGKSHLANGEGDDDPNKPNPAFVRWVSSKEGISVAVPEELLGGPAGRVFIPGGLRSGKMVEEVS
jgi:Ino eighty subunit 2